MNSLLASIPCLEELLNSISSRRIHKKVNFDIRLISSQQEYEVPREKKID